MIGWWISDGKAFHLHLGWSEPQYNPGELLSDCVLLSDCLLLSDCVLLSKKKNKIGFGFLRKQMLNDGL